MVLLLYLPRIQPLPSSYIVYFFVFSFNKFLKFYVNLRYIIHKRSCLLSSSNLEDPTLLFLMQVMDLLLFYVQLLCLQHYMWPWSLSVNKYARSLISTNLELCEYSVTQYRTLASNLSRNTTATS